MEATRAGIPLKSDVIFLQKNNYFWPKGSKVTKISPTLSVDIGVKKVLQAPLAQSELWTERLICF